MGTNGMGMGSYVYAIGRVEARFPNLAAEKKFAQATGRADTAGRTDQQAFHEVLSQRHNRYLVRQLCWVLTIQGLETYLPEESTLYNVYTPYLTWSPAKASGTFRPLSWEVSWVNLTSST